MAEEKNKIITREKHPGSVPQGHKLAALRKKRKEEILRNKEQTTVQSTEHSIEQPSVQSTVQSNYVCSIGILAIGVCVFFAYNTFRPKKQANEKQDQPPRLRHML